MADPTPPRPRPAIVPSTSPEAYGQAPVGDLRSYLSIVRRRKWALLLVVLLTVGAAAFFSYRQLPMYRSTATVLVKPLNPNQILQGYNYNFAVSMQTEQALATSPAVAELASEYAREAGSSAPNDGEVSTRVPTDTTFLEVAYTSTDPAAAQVWAQAYADGYMEYRREQALQLYNAAQEGFRRKLDDVRRQIDDLKAQRPGADPATLTQLNGEIRTLESSLTDLTRQSSTFPFPVADTAAQMISPAGLPETPFEPNWTRNLIMALFAGLALGFAVAFVRERLDDRLAGREDLEEAAGAPVLAIVPHVGGWNKKSSTRLVARDAPKTAPAEAYRTLRTNVSFMAKTNDLKLIALTSPGMGDGKTTTTANLAVALAHTGKRVIAVSCDLRKPRLHRFFDLSNDNGVTSILRDGLSLPQAAQSVRGINTLRVIASGPVPHDPSELLGSEEMEQLLEDLRRYADFVLVDTAPVLVVSDALSVAPKTDGVLLMVDAASTMRGAVRATREQLELVGSNIVGAVFNNFDPSKAKMSSGSYRYHYYDGYQYHDGKTPEAAPRPRRPVDPADMWK
jgi:polysaccharide biosynthesis transport protein